MFDEPTTMFVSILGAQRNQVSEKLKIKTPGTIRTFSVPYKGSDLQYVSTVRVF